MIVLKIESYVLDLTPREARRWSHSENCTESRVINMTGDRHGKLFVEDGHYWLSPLGWVYDTGRNQQHKPHYFASFDEAMKCLKNKKRPRYAGESG